MSGSLNRCFETSSGSLHDFVSISSITIPKSQDESDETWHLCHGLVLVRLSNTSSEPFPVVPFAEVVLGSGCYVSFSLSMSPFLQVYLQYTSEYMKGPMYWHPDKMSLGCGSFGCRIQFIEEGCLI